MHNKTYHYLILFISFIYSTSLLAAISKEERYALITLYNTTDGAKWKNKTGWLGRVGTECNWFGISCLGDKNVSVLSLPNNNLKGTLPKKLSELRQIRAIDLSNNQLNSAIPAEFGRLGQLRTLNLSSNQLYGHLPAELGNLGNLGLLSVSINTLSGELPKESNKLNKLRSFFLSANQLSNSLPTEMGHLTVLNMIDLSNNHLTGTIPSSFSQLNQLTTLKLHQNLFTGDVQKTFKNSTKLAHLTLNDNCLTISLNDTTSFLNKIKKLDFGNQNSCQNNSKKDIPTIITTEDYSIKIPSVYVRGKTFKVTLKRHMMTANGAALFWRVSQVDLINKSAKPQKHPAVEFNSKTTNVTFNEMHFRNKKIKVELHRYINPTDTNGFYYQYKL